MGVGISAEGWFWWGIGRFRGDHGFSSSYGRHNSGSDRSRHAPLSVGKGCCGVCGTQSDVWTRRDGSQTSFQQRCKEWSRERAFAEGTMGVRVSLCSPYMHPWVGVQIVKLPDGIFCKYVFLGHPLVFRIGIALPLDEVLQLVPSSETPRGHHLLHFIFFFPVNKVRWRLIVVCAVKLCLAIRGQEVHMKHRM
jgi:hypothetical protein